MSYESPTLTVDLVLFQLGASGLEVLLLRRGQEPFQGWWALPGGYNARGETTVEAVARVARTKVGFHLDRAGFWEQLFTVDTVARDPRGHAVSVVYLAASYGWSSADGTEEHSFWSVDALPETAFDHAEIIAKARQRLASKLSYTNAVSGLLAPRFTLTQAQSAYEAVLGRSLDKRNFRKRFLATGFVEQTDETWTGGAHRPARLYRFKSEALQLAPSLIER